MATTVQPAEQDVSNALVDALYDANESKSGKVQSRAIRNRIAAQESRERKRKHVEDLTSQNAALQASNELLIKRLKLVENENMDLSAKINDLTTQMTTLHAQMTAFAGVSGARSLHERIGRAERTDQESGLGIPAEYVVQSQMDARFSNTLQSPSPKSNDSYGGTHYDFSLQQSKTSNLVDRVGMTTDPWTTSFRDAGLTKMHRMGLEPFGDEKLSQQRKPLILSPSWTTLTDSSLKRQRLALWNKQRLTRIRTLSLTLWTFWRAQRDRRTWQASVPLHPRTLILASFVAGTYALRFLTFLGLVVMQKRAMTNRL